MSKRELNLSDKKMHFDTKEDKILVSPPTIPDRGVQDIKNLKSIQNTDVAYYDIAPTENQLITSNKVVKIVSFMSEGYFHSNEGETMMGEINNI